MVTYATVALVGFHFNSPSAARHRYFLELSFKRLFCFYLSSKDIISGPMGRSGIQRFVENRASLQGTGNVDTWLLQILVGAWG